MFTAIVLLPLVGALIAGLFGRVLGPRPSMFITTALLMVAMILSWIGLFQVGWGGDPVGVTLFTWMDSKTFQVNWALHFDTLTMVMCVVVTTVSAMVHLYSWGYMSHDPSKQRFFSYISLFTFFMLMLVSADNLVQLYFGWEGVGLASYLLIGFWYDRPSANAAAFKAFVVNRVGDFGFALGIFGIYLLFDTVSYDAIFAAAPGMADATISFLSMELPALEVCCLLLFLGAMGKSAQLGLHTWLADAMEGPTPVSALIHAATMVTAGVFMLARLSPVFEYAPVALAVVTLVGALTCFVAATIGITQFDIKRVIAYSTMSQLGYMFFACGVSAYQAGIFHLSTHAAFKALLFLSAGSVIHAMSDEQDMRKMGGIWRLIPYTYVTMWMGGLALAGIWPFAGYFSKDMIIEAAWGAHSGIGLFAYWMGTIGAALTGLYTFRMIFMTFHGEQRADEKVMAHVHESPWTMLAGQTVLAVFALGLGMVGYYWFVGGGMAEFWGNAIHVRPGHDPIEAAHHIPFGLKILPLVMGVMGIGIAWLSYIGRPGLGPRAAHAAGPLYQFLYHKWYFDELYNALFVKPSLWIGRVLWKKGDDTIIDGIGPNGLSVAVRFLADKASRVQTGYVYHYAFAMLIGVVAFVSWYLLER